MHSILQEGPFVAAVQRATGELKKGLPEDALEAADPISEEVWQFYVTQSAILQEHLDSNPGLLILNKVYVNEQRHLNETMAQLLHGFAQKRREAKNKPDGAMEVC
jgi:hypothetical protein